MEEILGKQLDHKESDRPLDALTPSCRHWEGMQGFQAENVCVVVRFDPYKDHSVCGGGGLQWDRLAATRGDTGGLLS